MQSYLSCVDDPDPEPSLKISSSKVSERLTSFLQSRDLLIYTEKVDRPRLSSKSFIES